MSDPILHLTILQSPVFLLNSRLGHFSAPHRSGGLFSRSYETNLPSSLAMTHSSALGYSPRLPVSVYGTGCIYLKLRGFSWKSAWSHYYITPKGSVYYHVSVHQRICLLDQHLRTSTIYSVRWRTLRFSVTPSQYIQVLEY